MMQTLSLYALLIWFIWGLFMALGWTLGAWIMARILSRFGG